MAKARKAWIEMVLGWILACAIRLLGSTLKIRVHDAEGILKRPVEDPMVWALWHNRVLIQPYVYNRFWPGRRGSAMTSASGDGGLLAKVLIHFHIKSVRGSSSKRGAEALIQAIKLLRAGSDICIIPDGPRGPRYSFAPGPIRLAMKCQKPILPLHYEFSRVWRLKSWDAFIIPKPFSRVDVTLLPLINIPAEPPPGVELDAFLNEWAGKVRNALLEPLSEADIQDARSHRASRVRKGHDNTRVES